MAVTKSQKAAKKAAEEAAREKETATTAVTTRGSGDEGGPAAAVAAAAAAATAAAAAATAAVAAATAAARAGETVRVVDETGLEEIHIAMGELQITVKRLMVEREIAEERRREEMDEIRRALSKLTRDPEARQGNPPGIETLIDL
ncbi:unnamed protein product [Linum trigynum]|uniref:Uncharacterized protein n=1 Tax=Linum trigynum TaxID=586398 RepID=A0AAV2GS17_9ROSI